MTDLLIVDDNGDIRRQLKWGLSKAPYALHFATHVEEALQVFQAVTPGVVTLDLGLPPHPEDASQGLACLEQMIAARPSTKVIVITGFDGQENARRAVELGAYDFFRKPLDLGELKVMINRAFHLLEIERVAPAETPKKPAAPRLRHGIVGDCPAMRDVYAMIDKVAASDAPVLVHGESGTGKELVAMAIHQASPRRQQPLVSINCGAIPENLLESEFFGHERGAFTGATNTVKGKVEYAENGTLFLDEIGELPVNLQVKLLRFLQDMRFQRVGGRKTLEVNVRVLAATNVNIQEAMRLGQFREDLYYRIGVVGIHLPPLRDRGEDVVLLANHFLEIHGKQLPKKIQGFSPEAMEAIRNYPWPGNVRELENKVRRAIILVEGSRITPQSLGLAGEASSPGPARAETTLREARTQLERQMMLQALRRFEGNIVKASEALGVSRPTFYDLLRKHEIDPKALSAG
ncbi:two component, sigma54 specific, transcriptional regulator, Fis family [Solidesulfovibrio carbinoliphilus subsp. oakridgensis]|uniref:Two component, sigma54 specific, transcriptional regulator, Fis family n=1 Tax=Solidesulfovibrio carbinoliphilus subsp. oakridgensis TaxID=694327 RepID=G7QCF5_9BACT|nr:PEP-CTERM-box response regulator transcription factor [Solidesulfovibrio carbinoliphilus]EHJ46111.1 two component, sigma54 specific, transcriptional regulator, Fis family [Solidesulfovibrio carbinoliphilus subsp. oakridgensis]